MELKMKENAEKAKSKIILDIGGTRFTTSKSTLMAFEGSYFHAMLSSGHWQPDEDGSYFIDRNPKFFDIILDYMRTGKFDISDLNKKDLTQLQDDLDYFQIKLPTPIPQLITIPSTILNTDLQKTLLSMLPPGGQRKFRLIHDSSRGIANTIFDQAVKGIGPTLIVIKSNNNYVFGAYVQDVWGSGSGWIPGSQNTFLFTFGNITSPKPVKLLHKGQGNGIHISGCGMHLGDGDDLIAFCGHSCATPTVYTKVAPGYNAVSVDEKCLAGANTYTPVLMEVFAVETQ